jgi:Cdc6-like AAA superfamily ATPase
MSLLNMCLQSIFTDPNDVREKLENLRKWLLPPGREDNFLELNAHAMKAKRADGTCTWFAPEMDLFLYDDTQTLLILTGAAGVGKTTLSSWIIEKVARELSGKDAVYLSFYIRM